MARHLIAHDLCHHLRPARHGQGSLVRDGRGGAGDADGACPEGRAGRDGLELPDRSRGNGCFAGPCGQGTVARRALGRLRRACSERPIAHAYDDRAEFESAFWINRGTKRSLARLASETYLPDAFRLTASPARSPDASGFCFRDSHVEGSARPAKPRIRVFAYTAN